MDKYNVYFTIHLDENLNVCDFNKAVSQAYLDTVKRTIDVAGKLDVPIINIYMNHGVHFTLYERKVELYEIYREEYMKSWAKFRDMCDEAVGDTDIRICFENTDGFREYEKEAVTYLLESKVFALTWDIGHSHSVNDIDKEFILSHKDRLRHFHIHDGRGSSNHLTLGTGEIALASRLGLAKELGCRCVIETKTVEALRQSVQWLNEKGI